MRKIAKFLSAVLATAMVLGMFTFNTSAAFKDVSAKDEALYNAVTLLNSLGIAKGTSDTTYGASKKVTREQMAAFVFRLMKEGKSVEGGENFTKFTDLKDDTFYYMISWASENGIIKGRSETIFDPSGSIILQDCYVMLVRALGYEDDTTLEYPYGFIDVAERIGLDENLDSDIGYTDVLTRGNIAIILYNAFYAEMNETYRKAVSPVLEKPEENVASSLLYIDTHETVCHKIYGVEKIYRRIVATPKYSIDISAIGSGSEYAATNGIEPLGGEQADKVLVQTAAVVPEKDSTRLKGEKAVIEFEDLGLTGEADDYFLTDVVIYMKNDDEGTILGASAIGKAVDDVAPKIETSSSSDTVLGYYSYTNSKSYTRLRTGYVAFGTDKAYFFNKPRSVTNYAYSIYPYAAGDLDGSLKFKAGYNWSGSAVSFDTDTSIYSTKTNDAKSRRNSNHDKMTNIFSTTLMGGEGKYSLRYYDSNGDGNVDYLWMMPFTWGKIVDKNTDSAKVNKMHSGEASYRAYYNSSKKVPEIYVNGATVEGGAHADGSYVFAYVAGPAKYIKVASDDVNNSVKTFTSTCVRHSATDSSGDKNMSVWANGTTIYTYNSGQIIVGHITVDGSGVVNGVVSLSTDNAWGEGFKNNFANAVYINDTWELTVCGARVLYAKKVTSADSDVVKNYAVVQYINESEGKVVFEAGGIKADGTLDSDEYVYAFVDGKYQMVKQARKTTDGTRQDDAYYKNNGIVGAISTYEVENGKYIFKPYTPTANAAGLKGEDSEATHGVVTTAKISLDKFKNNVYRFVGSAGGSVPSELAPNGMKYVSIEADTKILVRYINSDGNSDYRVYDAENLPDFNTKDDSMCFTKTIAVLKNRTDTTITEYLAFMYCEIGGEIFDSKEQYEYRLILGNTQYADDEGKVIYRYSGVDPMTGDEVVNMSTAKDSSVALANFSLYKIDADSNIMNTTYGKEADLKLGSSDLYTLASYEKDSKLIFVKGATDGIRVTDKTVFGLLDRVEEEYILEEDEMLTVAKADDVDDIYYTPGENEMKLYIITDTESGEDLDYAKLVIVVRG